MSQELERVEYLPVLALRGLVLFPGVVLHFDIGREKSAKALNVAMQADQRIFLTAQRDIADDDPGVDGLFRIGCIAHIRQVLRSGEHAIRVVVEGESRGAALAIYEDGECFMGNIQPRESTQPHCSVAYQEAMIRHVRSTFGEYASYSPKLPPDIGMAVLGSDDMDWLADYIAANIPISVEYKQELLTIFNPVKRLERLAVILEKEINYLALEAEINDKVRDAMDENQRDYYLREQMHVIADELGYEESPEEECDRYNKAIAALQAPEEIKGKLKKEADNLFKMPDGSHEATVVRGYLDTVLEMPWGIYSTDKIDLKKAGAMLEKEHYGMKQVKERILELLAVYRLKPDVKGQILCLVGPPGVGKTSIAKSVAACMGRNFARVSLGGVHDEAEIRGHRRTYIGAMPGRIMNALKTAGTANPLVLLDEIDKLASDYKGDPSSALLEALDPEQNNTFTDHFLDLPFDLSKVLFLTTANDSSRIPGPLLDRMEVIELSSYTREDKFQIAKKHLLKKQLAAHGLTGRTCRITDSALYGLIDSYTREAGVRSLERKISALCRKAAVQLVAAAAEKVTIGGGDLEILLGPAKYKNDKLLKQDTVGVINGLAWTSVGGCLMQMEVSVLDGKGNLVLTGSLGDVMQESAKAAVSYVRSKWKELGIPCDFYKTKDIHIHATEAATPKDGPSAGVTMTTGLVSALTGIPIKRDIAMTGEVSILGRVLPIGGLKEKTMAAYAAGVKTVFFPSENIPDLEEIDPLVKEHLNFIPCTDVWTVINGALTRPIGRPVATEPIPDELYPPVVTPKSRKQRGTANELQ